MCHYLETVGGDLVGQTLAPEGAGPPRLGREDVFDRPGMVPSRQLWLFSSFSSQQSWKNMFLKYTEYLITTIH